MNRHSKRCSRIGASSSRRYPTMIQRSSGGGPIPSGRNVSESSALAIALSGRPPRSLSPRRRTASAIGTPFHSTISTPSVNCLSLTSSRMTFDTMKRGAESGPNCSTRNGKRAAVPASGDGAMYAVCASRRLVRMPPISRWNASSDISRARSCRRRSCCTGSMPYIARFNGRCTYRPSSSSVNIVMMLVRSSWVSGSRGGAVATASAQLNPINASFTAARLRRRTIDRGCRAHRCGSRFLAQR